MVLVWEQWYSRGNFGMISSDQCRSVEGDLRSTLNVVGTSVICAESFYRALKKCPLWPCMKTRLIHKID